MMSREIILKAVELTNTIKHAVIDIENNKMVLPMPKGITEAEMMEDGMMGKWFADNGFTISFKICDFAYQPRYRHTSYLRNRLVMTVTW